MKNNEKGIILGLAIIVPLLLFLILSLVFGTDVRTESIYIGLYLQIWGILFLLSFFYSHKTFFFRGLIWVCEHFSAPRGRKMAFFYFAIAFGLGSMSIFKGLSTGPQEPINEVTENGIHQWKR